MTINFRMANQADLPIIVTMLADDKLGQLRENAGIPLNEGYLAAFNEIDKDPNNELVVMTSDDEIVAMLQLTFIPYLTYQGSWRCLIEGVRVASKSRGQGLGKQLFIWAINRASERGCHLLQLTSDKKRPEALNFYKSLGFIASHEGFKLSLD